MALFAGLLPAHACSIPGAEEFEFDETSDDTVAPGAPGALSVTSSGRGSGPECADGILILNSCDEFGSIHVAFTAALDDRSPAEEATVYSHNQEGVGYDLRVVSGTLPDGLVLDGFPIEAGLDEGTASLSLQWADGMTDTQEPYAFTLGVTAVDLAGNLSDEVTIDLSDPGVSSEEPADPCEDGRWGARCGVTSALSGVATLIALAGVAARRRQGDTR